MRSLSPGASFLSDIAKPTQYVRLSVPKIFEPVFVSVIDAPVITEPGLIVRPGKRQTEPMLFEPSKPHVMFELCHSEEHEVQLGGPPPYRFWLFDAVKVTLFADAAVALASPSTSTATSTNRRPEARTYVSGRGRTRKVSAPSAVSVREIAA